MAGFFVFSPDQISARLQKLPRGEWARLVVAAWLIALGAQPAFAQAGRPFGVEVVDAETGRGVPLVELTTVDQQRFVTDSQGWAAIAEPELRGRKVYFHVKSHGYEFPRDGFGFRGKALRVESGGSARIELKRTNVAKRLYRATGGGIYRDSVLLGRKTPLAQPLLNAQVVGCDSVLAAVYRGRIFWFWGDTNRLAYPLGNFHMTGATSALPRDGGLDPSLGIDFQYFTGADGFARPMTEMPGEGPTWLSGLTVLRDAEGRERMYAHYVKIRNQLEAYRWGLAVWDDAAERFEHVKQFDAPLPALHGQDHSFPHRDQDGVEYVYFANPFPLTRVRADIDAFADPNQYERFTCLRAAADAKEPVLDRDAAGKLRYAWRKNTPLVSQKEQAALIRQGAMRANEALLALRDVETGRAIVGHRGSVYWNDFRQRFVMIVGEEGGKSSLLGEIWYAEADAPLGPWVYARQIVTHDRYTFYNPKQHPFFDQAGGRILYFEGTYTHTFSGNAAPTPRYDYNQIMYRLDLNDSRLALPVAVYDSSSDDGAKAFSTGAAAHSQAGGAAAFFAWDRAVSGAVAVFAQLAEGHLTLVAKAPPAPNAEPTDRAAAPRFFALPANLTDPPPTTTPLLEFLHAPSGQRHYTTDSTWSRPGYQRTADPVCRVWINPHQAQQ